MIDAIRIMPQTPYSAERLHRRPPAKINSETQLASHNPREMQGQETQRYLTDRKTSSQWGV